jgi:hypothetical protein
MYEMIYQTYLNGNISDARTAVQSMTPDELLALVIAVINQTDCDDAHRFFRLMRSH